MFIFYFLIWVLFNGRLTLEIALFGVAIAAAIYWFTCKFMGYSFQKDVQIVKKAGRIGRLLATLFVEIVKANWQVIGWVYNRKKPMEPAIVEFTADLEKTISQVALADCITLTPGTITGYQDGNHFVVHCLDKSMAEGMDQSVFVEILKELEEN